MLYERDYFQLTDQERIDLKQAQKQISKNGAGVVIDFEKFPKAGYFYESLFPNNMLDNDELRINERTTGILRSFQSLIDDKSTTERDILNFIKLNRAYFIVASVLTEFRFGHHSAYAFPEFELPPNHKVDYLIIGKSSYGHEFIFIELENPHYSITTKEGDLGTTIRKGNKQVNDWNNWIEANFSHLQLMFQKFQGPTSELPKEFLKLDTSRIHYIVVAGRRTDFKEETYRIARKMKSNRIGLLHYDNLIDRAKQVLENKNYV